MPGVIRSTTKHWVVAAAVFCASAAGMTGAASKPAETQVWPAPPQQARIKYVKSVAVPEDMGREKGIWRRLVEFIKGPEDESMQKPMAVAADANGRIYVADPVSKRIHIYDQREGEYSYLSRAGKISFEMPIAVAIGDKGQVFVADAERRKVFRLDGIKGRVLGEYGDDQLERPTGVAVDLLRRLVYVLDTPQHEVEIYSLDDGTRIDTIGSHGVEAKEFNYPSHIATDVAGNVYVTDALNARVQVFGLKGESLSVIGQRGDGSGDFSAPKGVGVDSDGHVYVADASFDNIQIFDMKGRLLLTVGAAGQRKGEFWMPTGIFIDKADRIYVADSYNQRIQIFQYLKTADRP